MRYVSTFRYAQFGLPFYILHVKFKHDLTIVTAIVVI